MEIVAFIAIILFAVLNFVLFFKVWGMTNDVSKIADYVLRIANRTNSDSTEQAPTNEKIITSTAAPTPNRNTGITSTEDPNKDSQVSPVQWVVIVLVVVAIVALLVL